MSGNLTLRELDQLVRDLKAHGVPEGTTVVSRFSFTSKVRGFISNMGGANR